MIITIIKTILYKILTTLTRQLFHFSRVSITYKFFSLLLASFLARLSLKITLILVSFFNLTKFINRDNFFLPFSNRKYPQQPIISNPHQSQNSPKFSPQFPPIFEHIIRLSNAFIPTVSISAMLAWSAPTSVPSSLTGASSSCLRWLPVQ